MVLTQALSRLLLNIAILMGSILNILKHLVLLNRLVDMFGMVFVRISSIKSHCLIGSVLMIKEDGRVMSAVKPVESLL